MAHITLDKTDKNSGEVTGSINLEVRVYPIADPKGSTKGFASITVEDTFGVHGISIIEGKNGLFVAMPQTKDAKGEYRDIFHPITSEGRKALQDAVLAEYSSALTTQRESPADKARDSTVDHSAPSTSRSSKEKKKSEPER